MLVLLDATILTNFARVDLTSVMRDLWGDQVCTTVDVLMEYEAGIKAAGLPPSRWKQLSALKLTPMSEFLHRGCFRDLDQESEAVWQ